MPPDTSDYLIKIGDSTSRMEQLVDDLLAFSRAGRQALNKTCIDVDVAVRKISSELEKQQDGRHIDMIINPLPACFGDISLLRQVFFNLIDNALKFTRHRSNAKIEIGCMAQSEEQIYFVRDNGAGFDMKYVSKLFEAFQRLHTDKEFEGTGIGLSIVQRIILRHGGRVWAESVINKGATFYFTLPPCRQGDLSDR